MTVSFLRTLLFVSALVYSSMNFGAEAVHDELKFSFVDEGAATEKLKVDANNITQDHDVKQASSRIVLDGMAPPANLGFPRELTRDGGRGAHFENPEYIFTGSFGDVWKAKDKKRNGIEVAVKLFYVREREGGPAEWMTWNKINRFPNKQKELEDSMTECSLMDDMMRNENIYPSGARHICGCYKEHISDGYGLDAVLFLVLEMCGSNLDKMLQNDFFMADSGYPHNAREVIKQMLEGLHFTTAVNQPPVVHRDIKPENVNFVPEKSLVKFIDWGLWDFGVPQHQAGSPGGTPGYMPPDCLGQLGGPMTAFGLPAYASDVYATGIMYMQFLCKNVGYPSDWNWPVTGPVYRGPGMFSFSTTDIDSIMRRAGCSTRHLQEDIRLISQMCSADPRNRISPKNAFWVIYDLQNAGQSQDSGGFPRGTVVAYTKGGLVKCKVHRYNAQMKTYDLDKDGFLFRQGTSAANVREWTQKDEQRKASLQEGDVVGYWSATHEQWIQGIVLVDKAGNVDLRYTDSTTVFKHKPDLKLVKPWSADMMKDKMQLHQGNNGGGIQQGGHELAGAMAKYEHAAAPVAPQVRRNKFTVGERVATKDPFGVLVFVHVVRIVNDEWYVVQLPTGGEQTVMAPNLMRILN